MGFVVKFLESILGVPLAIQNAIVHLLEASGVSVPSNYLPYISVSSCLFLCAVAYLFDRFRSALSKIILLYSLLCIIFIFIIDVFFTFRVDGYVQVQTTTNPDKSDSFPTSRLGSDSCDANEIKNIRFCSATISKIDRIRPNISSANCGSGIQSSDVEGANPNCVNVKAHLLGCGYDRLPFGINNCRGRGWLEFQIQVFGSTPVIDNGKQIEIKGHVGPNSPLVIDAPSDNIKPNQKIIYHFSIKDEKGNLIILDNEHPSAGPFSVNNIANGKIEINFGQISAGRQN